VVEGFSSVVSIEVRQVEACRRRETATYRQGQYVACWRALQPSSCKSNRSPPEYRI
jgi:hypothetical protein